MYVMSSYIIYAAREEGNGAWMRVLCPQLTRSAERAAAAPRVSARYKWTREL